MSTQFRRDMIAPDPDAARKRRHSALAYSIDQLRRGASAIAAASDGETNEMRRTVLIAINERLESMLRELRALT